jgi:hypothetical protein
MTIPTNIAKDPVKRRDYIFKRVGREDDQTPLCPLEKNCELDGGMKHE